MINSIQTCLSHKECMIYCQLESSLRPLQLKIVALIMPLIWKEYCDGNLFLNMYEMGVWQISSKGE